MNLQSTLHDLPPTNKKVISILSGGLDSSTLTMLLIEKYGADNVSAISFDYGQKQKIELLKATELCASLGITHKILDLKILGDIARPMSANIVGTDIKMPTIEEVIGDPVVPTYVPNRNMIMYSIVAAQAEVIGAEYIFCGLQVHDSYGYWDVTQEWVDMMNSVLALNRKHKIKIISPFSHLSKFEEINLVKEMNKVYLLSSTLTCYNPNEKGESCGRCPSCSERIMNFAKADIADPIPYSISIDWDRLIENEKENV